MDKELASFHTYLFSLCVNAAAAQATSTGNRQLKLTRRSWLPAEQYCQVEQASTAPAQTSWQTGLISLAMIATLPPYPVLYNSFRGSSYFLQLLWQTCTKNATLKTDLTDFSTAKGVRRRNVFEVRNSAVKSVTPEWGRQRKKIPKHTHALSQRGIVSLLKDAC